MSQVWRGVYGVEGMTNSIDLDEVRKRCVICCRYLEPERVVRGRSKCKECEELEYYDQWCQLQQDMCDYPEAFK